MALPGATAPRRQSSVIHRVILAKIRAGIGTPHRPGHGGRGPVAVACLQAQRGEAFGRDVRAPGVRTDVAQRQLRPGEADCQETRRVEIGRIGKDPARDRDGRAAHLCRGQRFRWSDGRHRRTD